MNLLAWLLIASAVVLNGYAIVAVLLTARGGSPRRTSGLATICGRATLGFIVLWEAITAAQAMLASPPPGGSGADHARWRASVIAASLYSAVFIFVLALIPAAAAWWLHRRRRAEAVHDR